MLPEQLSEIAAGAKAAAVGDLGDRLVRFCQSLAGFAKPVACHIFHGTHMQILPEQPEANPFADVSFLCKLIHRNILRVMGMDVAHHGFHFFVRILGTGLQFHCRMGNFK